ncbi:MAG: hypothetical protein ACE5J3_04250 [Methanosarcinales archaeon]
MKLIASDGSEASREDEREEV